ncbi:hypothetical protein LJR164_001501 [Phenylobacterium sp. LjRoot164]|uniref:hypothetical protein n=1 Tax=unclassified Phenylobacterium TaxID=2640670 RepID=UPI003ECF3FDF
MQQHLIAALAGIVVLTAPHAAFTAEPLECPVLSKLGPDASGKLASELVPDPRALNDIGGLTRTVGLFREHGFSDADTVNYLTAMFCPVIRDDRSLSAAAKSEKVASFSSVTLDIVYRQGR